jgi:biopolymer transport protein ExbD
MNTTPLIDVLLVILIMLILSVPVATHSLDVPLPRPGPTDLHVGSLSNRVVVTGDGALLWNGHAVSQGQLLTLLRQTRRLRVEPELQFEPEANASYELSARVLNLIKGAGVTKLGFVGNERYRRFARGD